MPGHNSGSGARRRRRRRRRRLRLRQRRRSAVEKRDWAELPLDLLTLIFRKVGVIDVLWRAQAVCRPWRQLVLDPDFWRIIDIRCQSYISNTINMNWPTQIAVDRSGGHIEELYLEHFVSEGLLKYIAERSTGLRRLVLKSAHYVQDEGLIEFITHFRLLEELQITKCCFRGGAYKAIGQACPKLKCFRLCSVYIFHFKEDRSCTDYFNDAAFAIADSMPQLRELQLFGNLITNKGLHAILDNCLQLESLDLRICFNLNINLDAGLRAKLTKIKNVNLPIGSNAHYEFVTGLDENFTVADYFGLDEELTVADYIGFPDVNQAII